MYNKDVYKTWALVIQLGFSMIVPILLLIAIGYFVDKKFNVSTMLIFVLIGFIVGIRNVYVILKNYLLNMSKNKSSDLMKKHMKQFDK